MAPVERLRAIVSALRDPETGCPWDIEQSFRTIAPYTIEEAYEVADAIDRNNMAELKEELGDLLLQVVFHSQMAAEDGHFSFDDVATAISDKMERRHPHVFGEKHVRTADEQTKDWEQQKAAERAEKSKPNQGPSSALDGVAAALPALMRAEKLQKRAARVGFDWPSHELVLAKLSEELAELDNAIDQADDANIDEEIGDILFVCANLARKLGRDPEVCLRSANAKFERRFRAMETLASEKQFAFERLSLEGQEALWAKVKASE